LAAHGTRRYLKAAAVRRLTVPILRTVFDGFCEYTESVGPDSQRSVILCEYFPQGKMNSVPQGATPFNNRGNWLNMHIVPDWGHRTDLDAYSKQWVHSLVEKLVAAEKQDELLEEGEEVMLKQGYWNGSWGEEKSSLVFGRNYEKLRLLKRKYDPNMVFKKWYPITPAEIYN
jgi:hypothetical protein